MPLAVVTFRAPGECPSRGLYVPEHMLVCDPFKIPFVYGPNECIQNINQLDVSPAAMGAHAGLKTEAAVAGVFIGSKGHFLVMSQDTFIILTPKDGVQCTLGTACFPSGETHVACAAEKGKAYLVREGSAILSGHAGTSPLKHFTLFLDEMNTYHVYIKVMDLALTHFNRLWCHMTPRTSNPSDPKIQISKFGPQISPQFVNHQNLRITIASSSASAWTTATPKPSSNAATSTAAASLKKTAHVTVLSQIPEDKTQKRGSEEDFADENAAKKSKRE